MTAVAGCSGVLVERSEGSQILRAFRVSKSESIVGLISISKVSHSSPLLSSPPSSPAPTARTQTTDGQNTDHEIAEEFNSSQFCLKQPNAVIGWP